MANERYHEVATVVKAETRTSRNTGRPWCPATLALYGPEGNAEPREVEASVGPVFGYLIEHVVAAAASGQSLGVTFEDSDYRKDDGIATFNIVGIDGIVEPADWSEQLKAQGMGGGEAGGAKGGPGAGAGQVDRSAFRLGVLTHVADLAKAGIVKSMADWSTMVRRADDFVFKGKLPGAGA